jgi:hypothetical protein
MYMVPLGRGKRSFFLLPFTGTGYQPATSSGGRGKIEITFVRQTGKYYQSMHQPMAFKGRKLLLCTSSFFLGLMDLDIGRY